MKKHLDLQNMLDFTFIHPHLNKEINSKNSKIHLHQICYEWQDIQVFFQNFEELINQNLINQNLEWVGYIYYEAGYELLGIDVNTKNSEDTKNTENNNNDNNKPVIAEFIAYEYVYDEYVYDEYVADEKLIENQLNSYLQPIDTSRELQSKKQQYITQIQEIQKYITQGHTYQINHTFALPYRLIGTLQGLFYRLYPAQKTTYGCFLKMQHQEIACFSPELLVEKQGQKLICKPMKGTSSVINRTKNEINDELHNVKNHAENVMIVDLLRHDLNRLTHDVKVTELFGVEYHQTIAQMTSTIEANFSKNKEPSIIEVLQTLFPCGSIIGAPKKRSMEIIHEIENRHRGVYTGAIGWGNLENYQLTVPIRTFAKSLCSLNQENSVTSNLIEYNTGSGITIESQAEQEWEECLLKTAFLKTAEFPTSFGLLETMKGIVTCNAKNDDINLDIPLFKLHMERLRSSFLSLFAQELTAVHEELIFELIKKSIVMYQNNQNNQNNQKYFTNSINVAFNTTCIYRIRLQANLNNVAQPFLIQIGELPFETFVLLSLPNEKINIQEKRKKVLLNPTKYKINEKNWSQHYKTTIREHYNKWYDEGEKQGFYDVLAVNSQNNIAESCRHILLIWDEKRHSWITPHQKDGALNSVYVTWLQTQGVATQGVSVIHETISIEKLLTFVQDENSIIYLANAIRGAVLVEIIVDNIGH